MQKFYKRVFNPKYSSIDRCAVYVKDTAGVYDVLDNKLFGL